MKLQRIILTCLLALLVAAPAVAGDLCVKTAKIVKTYTLDYYMPIRVSIEAASPEGYGYCLTHNCVANYLVTWTSPCFSGKKEGKVSSGRPEAFFLPACKGGGTVAIMVTSGCITPSVNYNYFH